MPVLIKRYQNRKLYNTQSKSYITLDELADLVREEQEIKVIDNKIGKDITAVTLSQIIFEVEKNHAGFLPIKLLISLVQSGGNKIDEIRRNIFEALSLFHHYDIEIERRINLLIDNGELSQEQGGLLLEKLLAASESLHHTREDVESKIFRYLWSRQIPTESDLQEIIRKVDHLSQRVDELNLDDPDQVGLEAPRS
jgi:polyhydroxyalkanoate synthesis repressor PhaR